jgi:hypothetical protein
MTVEAIRAAVLRRTVWRRFWLVVLAAALLSCETGRHIHEQLLACFVAILDHVLAIVAFRARARPPLERRIAISAQDAAHDCSASTVFCARGGGTFALFTKAICALVAVRSLAKVFSEIVVSIVGVVRRVIRGVVRAGIHVIQVLAPLL